jgi:GNAT superfamily N-acetyltransferase
MLGHVMPEPAYSVTLEPEPRAADLALLGAGLDAHALPHTRTRGFLPLAVFLRDERGAIVGGVSAAINWNWVDIKLVWVAEALRRGGHGRRLMAAVEQAARERGCRHAHLDTFSYQARPFYERLGYEVFAALEDYPPGHRRYFMRKAL